MYSLAPAAFAACRQDTNPLHGPRVCSGTVPGSEWATKTERSTRHVDPSEKIDRTICIRSAASLDALSYCSVLLSSNNSSCDAVRDISTEHTLAKLSATSVVMGGRAAIAAIAVSDKALANFDPFQLHVQKCSDPATSGLPDLILLRVRTDIY